VQNLISKHQNLALKLGQEPDLWEWLSTKVDHLLGLSPGVMMLIMGALIVLFPVVVMVLVLLWRRRTALDRD